MGFEVSRVGIPSLPKSKGKYTYVKESGILLGKELCFYYGTALNCGVFLAFRGDRMAKLNHVVGKLPKTVKFTISTRCSVRVNCYWPSPAQSFIVSGLMTKSLCLKTLAVVQPESSTRCPVQSGRVNCCWSSPALLFLVPSPMGHVIFYCLTTLSPVWWHLENSKWTRHGPSRKLHFSDTGVMFYFLSWLFNRDYIAPDYRLMNVEQLVQRELAGETKYWDKTRPNATSSTTDLIWPGMRSKPGRWGEKPENNSLNYVTTAWASFKSRLFIWNIL
jgi:hypothetical protein